MKYIIFLILLIALIITIFYFDRKQSILKHQLLVANSQNNNLRSKLSKFTRTKESIQIKYLIPTDYTGLLKEKSNVLIAPIESSNLLQTTQVKMEVKILDKAEILRDTWFYVALPIDSNINSRGWVKQSDFSLFYNNSRNITKSF